MITSVMFDISIDYYGIILLADFAKYYKVVISQFDKDDKLIKRYTYYFNKDYNLSLQQARYIISHFPDNSKLIIKNIIELENF